MQLSSSSEPFDFQQQVWSLNTPASTTQNRMRDPPSHISANEVSNPRYHEKVTFAIAIRYDSVSDHCVQERGMTFPVSS